MKSFTKFTVLSAFVLGASAQSASSTVSGGPTATSLEPQFETCRSQYNGACPWICGGNSGSECAPEPFFGRPGESCIRCPDVPSVCPAQASKECAFICEQKGFNQIDEFKFCSPSDLKSPEIVKCTPCSGTPTTSGSPSSTVEPLFESCPAKFNPECPWICGGKSGSACATDPFISIQAEGCKKCPGGPNECPTKPDGSCAFLCTERNYGQPSDFTFCATSDITGPEVQSCKPCDSNAAPQSSSATGSPTGTAGVPVATGGASTLKVGSAMVFGLFCMIVAAF